LDFRFWILDYSAARVERPKSSFEPGRHANPKSKIVLTARCPPTLMRLVNIKRRPVRAALLPLVALAFVFFAAPAETFAAWRAAGDVRGVERVADGVVLTLTSGARVAVTFRDIETVRVRLAPTGKFERDFSYAVESKDRKTVAVKIEETPAQIKVFRLDGTSVVVRRRPFLLTVLDHAGRAVVEDDPLRPTSIDLETGAAETSKRRVEWETYYGFGEKAMPASRHTQHLVMWNTDTYGYPRGLDPIYQSIGFFVALRREQNKGNAYGSSSTTRRAPTSTWARPTPSATPSASRRAS
jgi:hypothetical protein